MATRSVSAIPAEGENMTPGKAVPRTRAEGSNRRILGELTGNAKLDNQPKTSSPLKRNATVFDNEARGFTYIKRRRLSHKNALSRRIVTPPSPPSSKPQGPEHDSPSDPDSGRESQNSNVTRGSFSSLINYDPSSQQHSQHPPLHTSPPLSIKSHVEMLSLRLRIALYKVRTNQINVPFPRLKLHVKLRPKPTRLPSQSPDPLPMAPPMRPTDRHSNPIESNAPSAPPLLSTPNMYSNRFMPFHAPSSSPPLVQNPLSRIAREAQARMQADRDSLDSEATELADDHDHDHDHDQDDHPVAESPLDRRHIMIPTGT